MLDARLIRLSPKAHPARRALSRHAVFWMLDWATSFDLCLLTSILGRSSLHCMSAKVKKEIAARG
jgi:hypothetical protein